MDKTDTVPPEFLPYVSSLDAARSRRGRLSSRLLLYAVSLTFFVLLFWAALAEIEETVVGSGQIIPSQRVQQIQNLEGGILREVLTREARRWKRASCSCA